MIIIHIIIIIIIVITIGDIIYIINFINISILISYITLLYFILISYHSNRIGHRMGLYPTGFLEFLI